MKINKLQIQEAQPIPSTRNMKKTTPRYTIIKLLTASAKEESYITCRGTKDNTSLLVRNNAS